MSICQSGIESKTRSGNVLVNITTRHPLIKLARTLPWRKLVDLILPDVQKTYTGKWKPNGKLNVRLHLGVYLLQQLFNKSDRQIEYDIKDNAAYQIFCGRGIVEKWHVPHHTKIKTFRSYLSEETQRTLADHVVDHAVKLGFVNGSGVDSDFPVQPSKIVYPANNVLLKKLSVLSARLAHFFNKVHST